jgi:DNA gyrase subunit B
MRGVTERHIVDGALLRSAEARRLDEMAPALQKIYGRPAVLKTGEIELRITGPIGLVEAVLAEGRKGISINRYKGLGEMNPEQLWETTLDPNQRALLQVKVSDAVDASKLFETLMGDVVEPRRDFIQTHALEVQNLDI